MTSLRGIENKHFAGGNSSGLIGELASSRCHGRRATAARAGIAWLMSIAAIILCTPLRARASTVIATITGSVTSGTDYTGVFIAPGGDLTGYPYTLVFTMDDTQGIPIYGTWPADCDNGLQSSGLNTPVPKAVLTINGKSYTFGTHTPSSVSSWVYSFNATVPQTELDFALRDSFDNSSDINGWETIFGGPSLDSVYSCRDWESPFTYTLVPQEDSGSFLYTVQLWTNNISNPFVDFGEGYLSVDTVSVSGPIGGPPPALSLVSPFLLGASDLSNLDLATLLPKLPSLASAEATGLVADGTSAAIALWATNTAEDVTFTTSNGTTLLPYVPSFLAAAPTVGSESLTIPAANLITIGSVLYAAALVQAPPPAVTPSFSDPIIVTAQQGTQTGGVSMSLVPPPVLLVHGIWGNENSLSFYKSTLTGEAPWSNDANSIYSMTYPGAASFASSGSIGAMKNEAASIIESLQGQGVVGARMDVIAHSMGGLLLRSYSSGSQHGPCDSDVTMNTAPYRSLQDRCQGQFHTIVTLDTPEDGSALATYLLQHESSTVSTAAPNYIRLAWILFCGTSDPTVTVEQCFAYNNMSVTGGAVASLVPNNKTLNATPSPNIPDATWRALTATDTSGILYTTLTTLIEAINPPGTAPTLSDILRGPNDDIVALASQLTGPPSVFVTLEGLAHTTINGHGSAVTNSSAAAAVASCWLRDPTSPACSSVSEPTLVSGEYTQEANPTTGRLIIDPVLSEGLIGQPLALHVQADGVKSLEISQLGPNMADTDVVDVFDSPRLSEPGATINVVPRVLGKVRFSVLALFSDGTSELANETVNVSVEPSSITHLRADSQFTQVVMLDSQSTYFLAPQVTIRGLAKPVTVRSLATYRLVSPAVDPPVIVDLEGKLTSVHPGTAIIEVIFEGHSDRVNVVVK
jgi:pimeloyl-ACP methyl ester carboxylesterase